MADPIDPDLAEQIRNMRPAWMADGLGVRGNPRGQSEDTQSSPRPTSQPSSALDSPRQTDHSGSVGAGTSVGDSSVPSQGYSSSSGSSYPWLSYSGTSPYTVNFNSLANFNLNDTAGHQGTINSTGAYFSNGSNYINATVAGLNGKSATWKLVSVCDQGVSKQMYVLGSDPF